MAAPLNKFKVTVPATSANIGPGFDVLGMAFSLYLTLDCERLPAGSGLQMTYEGEGAKDVPLVPEKNLITKTALYVLSTYGITSLPPLKIHVTNPIPLGRGLGSSGSAVVAGVVLANAAGNLGMTKDRMLDYCLMVERHPDNVAPALFGGFVASFLRELEPEELEPSSIPRSEPTRNGAAQPPTPVTDIGHYIQLGWAKEIKAIAVIPDFEVATEDARAVLPDMYERADVIYNLQRIAVLTTALSRTPVDADLIHKAMSDKVHQPYRKHLIPGMSEMLEQITPKTYPGVVGICLSGAGPTILVLATENFGEIAAAVQEIFKRQPNGGIESMYKVLDVVDGGAQTEYFD
ncbi:ribosomal protein S5 domain 2-type protein [Gamsiella multidivaricata]|uniref:ribosomal protein S5 domain 2-type protein n=1 Tax=Gamsiella multidivaricata TaxID=101098 RepID=UPI00221F2C39|nr:ribosomal protein S5 domain 2-type protein [Gamsiella multidivaricata]KAI7817419.1 ribosomal protein S5 domain 2-type protein [Gamsiella multidivaricata]